MTPYEIRVSSIGVEHITKMSLNETQVKGAIIFDDGKIFNFTFNKGNLTILFDSCKQCAEVPKDVLRHIETILTAYVNGMLMRSVIPLNQLCSPCCEEEELEEG